MKKNTFYKRVKSRLVDSVKSSRISIQSVFVGFIFLTTVATATIAISSQYIFSLRLAADNTLKIFESTAESTQTYLAELDNRASDSVKMLALFSQFEEDNQVSENIQHLFAQTMLRNPLFHAVSVGFDNGDFYSIINLDADPSTREKLDARPEDRWVVVEVKGKNNYRKKRVRFIDSGFKQRHSYSHSSDFYFERLPWFADISGERVSKTTPYLFQHLQLPGQTYSIQANDGQAVIAVDVSLHAISNYLIDQQFESPTEIFIYQESGELVASNQIKHDYDLTPKITPITFTDAQQQLIKNTPQIKVSAELDWPPISFSASGLPYGYSVDILNYFSQVTGIGVQYVNGLSWKRLAEMFVNNELDVLQPVYSEPSRLLLSDVTQPFLDIPFGIVTKKGTQVQHIDQLKAKKVAIPDGWSLAGHIEEHYPAVEIIRVPSVKAIFDAVRSGEVYAAIDMAPVLHHVAQQYFIDDLTISTPLNFGDAKLPHQLHFMVSKSRPGLAELFNVVLAHLGSHYQQALADKWLFKDNASTSHLGLVPYKPLIQLAQQGGTHGLSQTTINGQRYYSYVIPFNGIHDKQEYLAILSPVSDVVAAGVEKVKSSIIFTVIALSLLLPIVWFFAGALFKPIRQLAANSKNIAQRHYSDVRHVNSRVVELNDLADSMDDMSDSIQEHEQAQEALLDAFIKVIAQAIDDKSPHTAGHCERVPELAFMLARQANKADYGIFEDFDMDTDEQWREFQVAAWLHDCGKITTPEHIIDKGTKLEAIYNRIHEIRMRFEVLWRDAEINFLTACSEPNADREALNLVKQKRQQKLQDDFAFIANANIGGEFMSNEDLERLQQLAQIPWQRYFDNTLGISHVELARYKDKPEPLPVTEQLLSDKAEHIIERVRGTEYPPEYGIKMEIPEHLYNMGELYNLSIKAGTLTSEDRFKINEHIIATIKMLESLPFPEELKNVPRYASTHHETTVGTGYPRQLQGDELSVPERVMVLADVYEALTASDRPYKKAKPISEAVHILYQMMQKGHVDRDVFDLFIRTGVYLDYAKNYLPESQIDKVDVSQYLTG